MNYGSTIHLPASSFSLSGFTLSCTCFILPEAAAAQSTLWDTCHLLGLQQNSSLSPSTNCHCGREDCKSNTPNTETPCVPGSFLLWVYRANFKNRAQHGKCREECWTFVSSNSQQECQLPQLPAHLPPDLGTV